MIELLGIFVGHVYYFFKFRYAQDFGGPDLLRTPMVSIINIFFECNKIPGELLIVLDRTRYKFLSY